MFVKKTKKKKKTKQLPQETLAVFRSGKQNGRLQTAGWLLSVDVLCVGWIVSHLWIHGATVKLCKNLEKVEKLYLVDLQHCKSLTKMVR